MSKLTKQY